MTTPAACTEAWRAIPSSRFATPSRSETRASFCSISRSTGFSTSAFSSVISSTAGICFATRSTSAYDMSITRPTSRTTAFAFMVPNVMICATFSRPYLRVT